MPDFNDDHKEHGPEAVRDAVSAAEPVEVPNDKHKAKPTQADQLVRIAAESDLFHTPDGIAYADMEVNGHRETWSVRSKAFKHWLIRRFYEEREKAPNSEALNNALNTIEAKAYYDGQKREVFVRVAEHEGKLYLDLCRDDWQIVKIDPNGWRVIDIPPIRFRRTAGMSALPVPETGGSINDLRNFLNISSDSDFVLVVVWLLAALRNTGPYPLLALSGEQGSAKSTFSGLLKKVADPNEVPLRPLPREERDIFIAANNGHVLAFDNLSGVPAWVSDTLCRLATGGGFATRRLYSDQDETLIRAMRPMILNGIEAVITRPDLADRAIILTLNPIPEEKRRSEKELYAAFNEAIPGILGALLDGLSHGLRELPQTNLDSKPRMADFALWGVACEGAFWPPGTFIEAYSANRNDVVENVIQDDPVASSIRTFMENRKEWEGTATELLSLLNEQIGEAASKQKGWPKASNALSGKLTRAATFLRKAGINVVKSKSGNRSITISKITDNTGKASSTPSISPARTKNQAFPADGSRTLNGNADDPVTVTAQPKGMGINALDDMDGTDEKITALSARTDVDVF